MIIWITIPSNAVRLHVATFDFFVTHNVRDGILQLTLNVVR